MLLSRLATHRSKSFIALACLALVVLGRGTVGLTNSLNASFVRSFAAIVAIAAVGGVGLSLVLIGRFMLGPLDAATRMGPVYIVAWIACCLMWGLSVQSLSRAGVRRSWQRVVFLSAVLPVAYFGSIAFVVAVVIGLTAAYDKSLRPWVNGWWLAGILILMPVAFSWAAGFVRTMLRGAGQSPNER